MISTSTSKILYRGKNGDVELNNIAKVILFVNSNYSWIQVENSASTDDYQCCRLFCQLFCQLAQVQYRHFVEYFEYCHCCGQIWFF